jgi:hypothetical protein
MTVVLPETYDLSLTHSTTPSSLAVGVFVLKGSTDIFIFLR